MTSTLSRRRVVTALAGLPIVGLSLAHREAAGAAPTFSLSSNLGDGYPYPGNVDRGGSWGPQYIFPVYGCFYTTDYFVVMPLNGFSGTVNLQILNLPAGVTSQTATSLVVQDRKPTLTSFKLVAASNAALGSKTVTIRATSGSIVKTIQRVIWVVDTLPPCVV